MNTNTNDTATTANLTETQDVLNQVTSGGLLVEMSHIGEGYWGEYDEDNPEDAALYRIDIHEEDDDDTWLTLCTEVEVEDQRVNYRKVMQKFIDFAGDATSMDTLSRHEFETLVHQVGNGRAV